MVDALRGGALGGAACQNNGDGLLGLSCGGSVSHTKKRVRCFRVRDSGADFLNPTLSDVIGPVSVAT
jgi:hypothetical protein